MNAAIWNARIAVVLPVYNGEEYISEAICSVLAQTYTNFELLIVDDGSTDGTGEVLSTFSDRRIRVIRLSEHRGIVEALNCGVRQSDGEFVARMDADDTCLPRRFERQLAYLEAHSEVGICGTWSHTIGDRRGARRPPTQPEEIRARMLFGGAMDHPSLMMRRAVIEKNILAYSDEFKHAEDFDFLLRASESTSLANLPEFLMNYRVHHGQVSTIFAGEQLQAHARLLRRQLKTMVPDSTPEEEELHVQLGAGGMAPDRLAGAGQWLMRLERINSASGRFDLGAFRREMGRRWFHAHASAKSPGLGTLRSYWQSPLRRIRDVGFLRHGTLVAKCLVGRSSGKP